MLNKIINLYLYYEWLLMPDFSMNLDMSSEDRRTKVDHDNPPFSRLFVVCSKNHNEEDIREAFGHYGTVSISS